MPQPEIANVQYPVIGFWDLPSRLWHWSMASCLTFSIYSGLSGGIALMDWHLRSGYAVLVLLLFRVAWGIWGGRYVRYRVYLHCLLYQAPTPRPHTRSGILMLVALMVSTGLQIGTGLFTTDDLFTEGPFNNYVSADTADSFSWIHRRNFWFILTLMVIHVTAITYYGLWRKNLLARAMFNGRKPLAEPLAHTPEKPLRAVITLATAVASVWWLLSHYG